VARIASHAVRWVEALPADRRGASAENIISVVVRRAVLVQTAIEDGRSA